MGFTGNYNEYFGYATDVDAVVYLMLVNDMIRALFPEAVIIGEDVSVLFIYFQYLFIFLYKWIWSGSIMKLIG